MRTNKDTGLEYPIFEGRAFELMPPLVPITPSLALSCLKSIPLNASNALEQVRFTRPLFEWQSTVDHLKDPPVGYLSEGVDLLSGLDEIAAKLQVEDGGYADEFEFLADLYTLASLRSRDGHFYYSSMLLDIFTFQKGVEFVSISRDGLALPEIYIYGNVSSAPPQPGIPPLMLGLQTMPNTSTTATLPLRSQGLTVSQLLNSSRERAYSTMVFKIPMHASIVSSGALPGMSGSCSRL